MCTTAAAPRACSATAGSGEIAAAGGAGAGCGGGAAGSCDVGTDGAVGESSSLLPVATTRSMRSSSTPDTMEPATCDGEPRSCGGSGSAPSASATLIGRGSGTPTSSVRRSMLRRPDMNEARIDSTFGDGFSVPRAFSCTSYTVSGWSEAHAPTTERLISNSPHFLSLSAPGLRSAPFRGFTLRWRVMDLPAPVVPSGESETCSRHVEYDGLLPEMREKSEKITSPTSSGPSALASGGRMSTSVTSCEISMLASLLGVRS
mmetsp:Transcript_48553/g.156308  ORF Transcript_48553/g.156308 Transcript_48553/m.156308 type:complete len:260 (-) Transcript_48553:223-1002(-)